MITPSTVVPIAAPIQRTVSISAFASPRSSASTALLSPVSRDVNIGAIAALSSTSAGSSSQ